VNNAVFVGHSVFGFSAPPVLKGALIEDLIMEFAGSPRDTGSALSNALFIFAANIKRKAAQMKEFRK